MSMLCNNVTIKGVTMDDIKLKIREFLSRSLRNCSVGDDDDFFELGLVNSLFAIQIVIFIEKNFGIELEDEDLNLDKIRTINSLVQLVDEKLGVAV